MKIRAFNDPYYSVEAFGARNSSPRRKASGKSLKIASRKIREQIMRDLGLVKVRGAMGGTYWE